MSINTKIQRKIRFIACLFLLSINSLLVAGVNSETFSIAIPPETDINVERFPADGDTLFVWQPHEQGLQAIDQQLAAQLAAQKIEVWLVDLLEAHFLPNTTSNMDRITGDGFQQLIATATTKNKRVVVAGSGRGAVPVLRGIRQWQLATTDQSNFAGVVLLSPKLFVETPDPGTAARFMPIARASNVVAFILQPNKSPWYWKLGQTRAALETSGSDVYIRPLDKLRDRFYFRPDAVEPEISAANQLGNELGMAIRMLTRHPVQNRTPATALTETITVTSGKKDRKLETYKGNPEPPPLNLAGLNGDILRLDSLKGKVVLVNFWATWCPPCVHEMPSMQRLATIFSDKPFTILGVNMAETNSEVEKFLATRVKVEFPIVMDTDGKALKDWSVFAFPTSYALDKQGRIRYALFGSVEWDDPAIVAKLQKLLNE